MQVMQLKSTVWIDVHVQMYSYKFMVIEEGAKLLAGMEFMQDLAKYYNAPFSCL